MNNDLPNNNKSQPGVTGSAGLNKEQEVTPSRQLAPEQIGVVDFGQEIELPKEVAKSGVSVVPQAVKLPQVIVGSGVQPSGHNQPLGNGATVKLPLNDDQIVSGLNQQETNSIRWLAEWCVRKLKQFHIIIKNVHGKITRAQIA